MAESLLVAWVLLKALHEPRVEVAMNASRWVRQTHRCSHDRRSVENRNEMGGGSLLSRVDREEGHHGAMDCRTFRRQIRRRHLSRRIQNVLSL